MRTFTFFLMDALASLLAVCALIAARDGGLLVPLLAALGSLVVAEYRGRLWVHTGREWWRAW